MMLRRLRTFAEPAALYVVLVGIWWAVADSQRGPASPLRDPAQLLSATWSNRSALLQNLQTTAWEALLGFLVGAGIALVLSLVTVRFTAVGALVERFALILYSLPLIAIAPLMVIWYGTGLTTKVIIAALAAFFPVLVNTNAAFVHTDRRALEMMQVIGASYATTSLRVRIPYALPAIFASFTIAAPSAVIGATVAEWVGGERGLGVSILSSMQSYNVDLLWSSILVVSLLSLLSYAVFAVLGQVLFPWHESVQRQGAKS
jgi:ABC-type nitrate/sulfonate/bicarbonate transport system permease component